jgi:hypothetical protein
MVENYRHHHAVQIVFVETPAAGSPKPVEARRPPAYPSTQRQHWRPQTRPPSKAEASKRLFDAINRNDQAAREYMAEARRRTA